MKIFLLLIQFTFLSKVLWAQEHIAPILYNPNLGVSNGKNIPNKLYKISSSLSLPFFDDFDSDSPIPLSTHWQDRQVYVNNTMGRNVISKGVATFDALNQYGVPYDTLNPYNVNYADSLTSQILDLSTYLPNDSIYLSFLFQAAGNGFAPESNDSLMLYFLSKKDGGIWQKVWSSSDSSVLNFKQILLPIKDLNYLHNKFQFRFVNKASIGTNDDVWNIDYIRIDKNRTYTDTLINDIAFTNPISSLLNDYLAMPYRQYIVNSSRERADSFSCQIKNNFIADHIISSSSFDATQTSPYSSALGTETKGSFNINQKSTYNFKFKTFSTAPTAATLYDKVIFESKFYIKTPIDDLNPNNDTINLIQTFDNYLAYDDGSAEMCYFLNLFPTLPGKIAIEHHLNTDDVLQGVAIYFGRQVPTAKDKLFSIVVYENIAYGASTTEKILYQKDNLTPFYRDTVNHFWYYKFDKPVSVKAGTFYIGTIQPALSGSDSLYFGLDRNRLNGNHVYYNVLDVWRSSTIEGALMIRPLLGQQIIGSKILEPIKELFAIFPNPSNSQIYIQYGNDLEDLDLQYTLSNYDGKLLQFSKIVDKFQPIDIKNLPCGNYILQLYNQNNRIGSKIFTKE